MSKNIGANRVKIVDNSGNEGSQLMSRAKAITVGADFEPGFNFQVYVINAGTIVLTPSDNDTDNVQINELERAYYKGDVSIDVPAMTMIPFLCKKIVFEGSDTFDVIVGR